MDLAYHTFLVVYNRHNVNGKKNIFGERGLGNWSQVSSTLHVLRLSRMSENVVKVYASKCFGYVAVIHFLIFNGQLAQLVEHLTEDSWVLGSKPRLMSCINSPFLLQLNIFHYTSFLFFSFFFLQRY
jgi:hypothetical protein